VKFKLLSLTKIQVLAGALYIYLNKIAFESKAKHPRTCAFSYAWSLPVTWQIGRSHHSIDNSRKPHVTRKPYGSVFYRSGVQGRTIQYNIIRGYFRAHPTTTKCSAIAKRPRCRVCYSFGKKWKTGTGRQYFT